MYVAVDWNGIAKDKFYKDEEAEVGYNQTPRYGYIMGNYFFGISQPKYEP